VKVRDGIARNNYADPGWFKHPAGTVAYEVDNPAAAPARQTQQTKPSKASKKGVEMNVVKPSNHKHH
jgi:hypothetical protein